MDTGGNISPCHGDDHRSPLTSAPAFEHRLLDKATTETVYLLLLLASIRQLAGDVGAVGDSGHRYQPTHLESAEAALGGICLLLNKSNRRPFVTCNIGSGCCYSMPDEKQQTQGTEVCNIPFDLWRSEAPTA
jgi:hypothetical protein